MNRNRTIPERVIILAFLLSAILLFGMLRLASQLAEHDAMAFDRAILLALRQPSDPATPIGPYWLRAAVSDVTALGGRTVLALFTGIALGYLMVARKHATALFLAFAVGGGTALVSLIKIGFAQPRPQLVAHLVEVSSASFPSGHAANSALVYLTLGAILARAEADRRLKIYLLGTAVLLTILVGTSRVYLGVHWPSDVLAGWAAGAGWALLCWAAAQMLQQRRRIERTGGDDAI